MTDKPTDSERDLQSIPDEWQDISLKEIVEADYEVLPLTDDSDNPHKQMKTQPYGRMLPPGRVPNQDSIDASSDDPRGTDEGYVFTGYDSAAATRIGDEKTDTSERIERLRELNEGRHRSDGQHAIREARRDKERLLEAICSSLPLAQHERERVISVIKQLDFERFGHQKGIPRVTLGAVVVVIDEKQRQHTGDIEAIVSWSDEFRQLCDAHDISMSDLSTIKKEIRTAIENGDVRVPQGRHIPKRDPVLPGPTPLSDRPDRYWENISAESWEHITRNWERVSDDFKDAMPDKYLGLVDTLRKWTPWETEEADDQTSTADSTPSEKSASSSLTSEDNGNETEELVGAMEEMLDEIGDDTE